MPKDTPTKNGNTVKLKTSSSPCSVSEPSACKTPNLKLYDDSKRSNENPTAFVVSVGAKKSGRYKTKLPNNLVIIPISGPPPEPLPAADGPSTTATPAIEAAPVLINNTFGFPNRFKKLDKEPKLVPQNKWSGNSMRVYQQQQYIPPHTASYSSFAKFPSPGVSQPQLRLQLRNSNNIDSRFKEIKIKPGHKLNRCICEPCKEYRKLLVYNKPCGGGGHKERTSKTKSQFHKHFIDKEDEKDIAKNVDDTNNSEEQAPNKAEFSNKQDKSYNNNRDLQQQEQLEGQQASQSSNKDPKKSKLWKFGTGVFVDAMTIITYDLGKYFFK